MATLYLQLRSVRAIMRTLHGLSHDPGVREAADVVRNRRAGGRKLVQAGDAFLAELGSLWQSEALADLRSAGAFDVDSCPLPEWDTPPAPAAPEGPP